MLSHQTSPMDHTRLRQSHRRQQSTPAHFEVSQQIPQFPLRQPQPGMHRRGMSVHPQMPTGQPHSGVNDVGEQQMVGITNQGHTPQHYLQEAQQHQARPGLQNHQDLKSLQDFRNLQHQHLDAQIDSLIRQKQLQSHSFSTISQEQAQKMERSKSNPYDGLNINTLSSGVADGLDNLASPFSPHRSRNARPLSSSSDTAFPATSRPPNWHFRRTRPTTPNRSISDKPLTPDSSPFVPQSAHNAQVGSAASDAMDTNATVRAVAVHSRPQVLPIALSHPDFFKLESEVHTHVLPSPPQTSRLLPSRTFDMAMVPQMPLAIKSEYTNPVSHIMTTTVPLNDYTVHQSQPTGEVSSAVEDYEKLPLRVTRGSVDFTRATSPHGTYDPMSEDFDFDTTKEETGISAEEVQAYISEADPIDGKWTCLYPECGKRLGRKENARAHVQTHLGDRQFKCIPCGKCFVRQHDLKRHAKVHSGVKPYPCRCGASFARMDALTRHRQRNVCSGGIGGFIKKAAKRGRPRKQRPDDDERADKTARTRRRVAAKSQASSVSGTSASSQAGSPESSSYDEMELEYALVHAPSATLHSFDLASFTIQSGVLARTPPMSPYSTGNPQSPLKTLSHYSQSPRSVVLDPEICSTRLITDGSLESRFAEHDGSQDAGHSSHFGSVASSPPELSHSSPPASSGFLDFDMSGEFTHSERSNARLGATDNSMHPQSPPNYEPASFENSPDDFFNESRWKDGNFLNFDGHDSGTYMDKFTGFDDNILFSDDVDTEGHLYGR